MADNAHGSHCLSYSTGIRTESEVKWRLRGRFSALNKPQVLIPSLKGHKFVQCGQSWQRFKYFKHWNLIINDGIMPDRVRLTPKEIAVMEDQAVAEGRMPALAIRKGLLEKIRAGHKALRRASNSEILRQLMYGRVKYPKGFSADDIYVHPGKDATDKEWDEYFDWMMKGKSVWNTVPHPKNAH